MSELQRGRSVYISAIAKLLCPIGVSLFGLFGLVGVCIAQSKQSYEIINRLPQHHESRYHHPHVAPDGDLIAYCVANDGWNKSTIWTFDVQTGRRIELTESDSTATIGDVLPRFSPDTKHIAFVSDRNGECHLWIVPVEGGRARQLTQQSINPRQGGSGVWESRFSWSPDGRRIVFSHGSNELSNLYTLDVESGELVQVTNLPGRNRFPDWGSDGQTILYVRQLKNIAEYWTLNIETRVDTKVQVEFDGAGSYAEWSPNMKWFVFQRMTASGFSTYITSYENGKTYRLGPQGYMSWGPTWDNSGDTVMFHSMRFSGPMILHDGESGTSEPILKGFYPLGRKWASWSPDGRYFAFNRIAYAESGRADTALYVVSVSDKQVRRVDSTKIRDDNFKSQSPGWMSTHGRLVSLCGIGEDSEICSVDTSGSHRVILTESKFEKSELVSSPDGEVVAFVVSIEGDEDIWLYDFASEEELQLTFTGGIKAHLAFSPDGANISYSAKQTEAGLWKLFSVSVDLATETPCSSVEADYTRSSWLDEDRIYYEVESDTSRYAEIYSLSEGRSTLVYSTDDKDFHCTQLSKDESELFYVKHSWIGSELKSVDLPTGVVSTFIKDDVARPVFSPDNSHIVYVRMEKSWPISSIWAADVRGITQSAKYP